MFVIGYGAGITAGAVAIDPRVERVTIAEIEPLVPEVVSRYFDELNQNVARSPKVQVRIDDGRHYIQTRDEKFDAVTTDLVDPWVKGDGRAVHQRVLRGVKQRLNPGGVMTMFVQLYETSPEAVKSEVATFFDVFPNSVIFGNTREGRGYDMVLVGQVEPLRIDLDDIEQRLARPEYALVSESLRRSASHRRRAVRQICRPACRFVGVAAAGPDQPRSRPAPAVPRGHGDEPVPEREDLCRPAGVPALPRQPLLRLRGAAAGTVGSRRRGASREPR